MTNCPKHINYRLLEVAADHAFVLLIMRDVDEAKKVLKGALNADLEYARYYLESDDGANLGVQNYWAIQEAEEKGHTVVDVLRVEGEEWTATIQCQAPNGQYYYIHLDDPDLRVQLDPDWHNFSVRYLWARTIPTFKEVEDLILWSS